MDGTFLSFLLTSEITSLFPITNYEALLPVPRYLPDSSVAQGSVYFSPGDSSGAAQPPSQGNAYPIPHAHNTPPHRHANASVTFVSPTYPCALSSDGPCIRPLHGTKASIREHLRTHGHKHQEREKVECPWAGCSQRLQWMSVTRHILSVHLRVRQRCPNCGKSFTRPHGLKKHLASEQCSSNVTVGV